MRLSGKLFLIGALIFVPGILGGVGCNGGSNALGSGSGFVFPLAVGNSWHYSRTYLSYDPTPASLAHMLPDTVFATEITTIEAVYELVNLPKTYVLHTEWIEGNSSGEGYSYRNNNPDGLYTYAYQVAMGSSGPPKLALREGSYLSFKGRRFSGLSELLDWTRSIIDLPANAGKLAAPDSLQYEDPPVRDIAYPIEIGRRWVYRDSANPWAMEKEVVGIERVSTAALTADCFKIRWYWDIDEDGRWDSDIDGYDYLAANGILKRRFDYYGIVIRNEVQDSLGTFNATDVYELTSYVLK